LIVARVGSSAWGTRGGDKTETAESLAYARAGTAFQICVRTRVYEVDEEDDWVGDISEEDTPWSSCDRKTKLSWVGALPELLGSLIDEAEKLIKASGEGTAAVKDVLNALGPETMPRDPVVDLVNPSGGGLPSNKGFYFVNDERESGPFVSQTFSRPPIMCLSI
jgi:hypothetical protein